MSTISPWREIFCHVTETEKRRLHLDSDKDLAEKWRIGNDVLSIMKSESQKGHRPETFARIDAGLRATGRELIWNGWTKRLWDFCHPPSADFALELTLHMFRGGFWIDEPPEELIRVGMAVSSSDLSAALQKIQVEHDAEGNVISPRWLRPIQEPAVSAGHNESNARVLLRGTGQMIPVVSSTAAGNPIEVIDIRQPGWADRYIRYPHEDLNDPFAFALEIEGDSMAPELRNGDLVIVSPGREPRPNRPVVFKVGEEKTGCKLYKPAGELIHFVPVNSEYEIQTYKREEISWVYPVIAMHRDFTDLLKEKA